MYFCKITNRGVLRARSSFRVFKYIGTTKIKTEVIKRFLVTTEYESQVGNSFKPIRESITRVLMKNRK